MPVFLILIKVTLLLVAALAVTIVMQRASAGSRHIVWLVALGALLLVPGLATWRPIQWRVLPASITADVVAMLAPPGNNRALPEAPDPMPSGAAKPDGSTSAPAESESATLMTTLRGALTHHLLATLVAIWLVVAIALASWLAHGAFSVRRIVRRARTLEHPDWQGPLFEIADRMGLEAAPRLVRSTDVKMPFACGLFRCTIVLPAESDGWSAERRSAVLIHELGHVRRRDLFGHTLGRVACAIYWFHPMVWTAARRLRAESERACDDLALRFGARPSEYAEHLLDIVTCVRDHATPSVALAMAHRKEFEGRMLAILNPDLRRTAFSRRQTVSLVSVLAILVVAVGAAAPARQVTPGQAAALAQPPAPVAEITAPVGAMAPEARDGKSLRIALPSAVQLSLALGKVNHPVDSRATEGDTVARAAMLIQMLRHDSAPEVRRIAAWGLNRYDDNATAGRALADALADDASDDVRQMAAWALSNFESADPAVLSRAALTDRSEQVREVAVWGLGNRGAREPIVLRTLPQALGDRSAQVRATAAWALGQFHLEAAPKELLNALGDSNDDVRFKAAWAAGEIADSAALPMLRAALRKEKASQAQRAQLRALILSGEDVTKMVEWLKSPDAGVREMAARALAGGGGTSPWPWPWPRPIAIP